MTPAAPAVATGAGERAFAAACALRALARDLGLTGLGGVLLLIGALVAWQVLVAAPQARLPELKQDIARLRQKQFTALPVAPVLPPARQIERFRAAFPDAATLPYTLTALTALAGRHKVLLTRGEYKLSEEPALRMLRYEARYPVKGRWRDVFEFLADMHNEYPTLVLDEMLFKRESRAAVEGEAQLRLSLYFRAPTTPAVAPVQPAKGRGNG